MVKVQEFNEKQNAVAIPQELLKGKRHLRKDEIEILEKNLNHNDDPTWENFYVQDGEGNFDPSLIHLSFFSGFIILGKLRKVNLNYNDLTLTCGIRRSRLSDVVTGDDNVIRNVYYLDNYRFGNRVILFNINELCCTKHSKFGNGILKEGEPESNRIWIGVANENDGRSVLPFESMIPADAYIWSHYRDDSELLNRFVELTEKGNDGKLNTYGFIDDDCVIKNSSIIKDAKIGKCAYIKGAFKLKNVSILSSPEEPSQIGEGVEMVNGIFGYGSRAFYQAIAVRFVIGRNCQVKYGARVLNSVLGDNSTISCCEVLNNLVFPFHEQHHNSSFLIATTIMGQSNIASGATIGSNHNSRFASFVLVSKGSYQNELDIPYPFALVSPGLNGNQAVRIVPAFWFMYDMFAITRNNNKFKKRDKRAIKVQNIETDPFAPDTMQEIMSALDRIISLTSKYLINTKNDAMEGASDQANIYQKAKDYLHQNPEADFVLEDPVCQKKFGATIHKPVQAYKTYRKIVKYFATRTLMEYCKVAGAEYLTLELIKKIRELPLFTEWECVGGQIIPSQKIQDLFAKIKDGSIDDWEAVHAYYNDCQKEYDKYKVRYALYLLEKLYSRPIEDFTLDLYRNISDDVTVCAYDIYNAAFGSREKDYTDYYRNMVYRNQKEMDAVIGPLQDNSFLVGLREDTAKFTAEIKELFKGLCEK